MLTRHFGIWARCLLLLGWLAAACGAPPPAPATTAAPPTDPPPPAVTIIALPTEIPTQPAFTPEPPPTATATAEPTAEPPCANDAKFISDITVPDGKQYLPGQTDNKRWSVRNAGTCHWGADYRLVLVSGDALGAPSEAALYPARAGTDGNWEIPITAPQNPGEYTGRWRARDPLGNLFGDTVFVKIEVIPLPPADTPEP